MGEGLGQLEGAEAWLGPVVGKTRKKKARGGEVSQWEEVVVTAVAPRGRGCREPGAPWRMVMV